MIRDLEESFLPPKLVKESGTDGLSWNSLQINSTKTLAD